jgi:hypothetical protein
MKRITALRDQTLFDIAIQQLGSVEGVFDILDANPSLRFDYSIPSGTKVWIPIATIDTNIIKFYDTNNLHPATGLEKEITL